MAIKETLRKALEANNVLLETNKVLLETLEKEIQLSPEPNQLVRISSSSDMMDRRTRGIYGGVGFWLNDTFNWKIETDELGATVLVARRR